MRPAFIEPLPFVRVVRRVVLRVVLAGLAGLAALATPFAFAAEYRVGDIRVEDPWARATAPGQPAGGGFLVLANGGAGDRLLSVHAEVSRAVELHTMAMENNTMRMRRVDAVDVPAGATVALRPGGLHVMFIGLKGPLNEGESFALTLRFERAGEVVVRMEVRSIGSGAAMGTGHRDAQGAMHDAKQGR